MALSISIPGFGPSFWNKQFGIDTFEDFQAYTKEYLEGLSVYGTSVPIATLQEDAWYFPNSGIGSYLTSAIAADFYNDSSLSTGLNWLTTLLQPGAAQTAKEATMGTLIIPGAFQVTMQAVVGGRGIDNVIGVVNSGGSAAGAAAAVKAAWEQVGNGPLTYMSSLIQMVNYHAVDIGSSTGLISDVPSSSVGRVSSGNSLATRAACAVVQLGGGSRSRSARGRMYWGPLMVTDLNSDGATMTSTSNTNHSAAFALFRSSLTSAGYPLAVLSRKHSIATNVASSSVESTIGTQRRRVRS